MPHKGINFVFHKASSVGRSWMPKINYHSVHRDTGRFYFCGCMPNIRLGKRIKIPLFLYGITKQYRSKYNIKI